MDVCLEELFSNIVRHGGPAASAYPKVGLTLEITPGGIRMTITDDGRPFDVSQAQARKSPCPWSKFNQGDSA